MVQPQRTAPGLPSPPRHKALQDSDRHSWSQRGHGRMRMEGPRWGKGRAPPPLQFPSQEAGPHQSATSHIFTLHHLQRPLLSTQPGPYQVCRGGQSSLPLSGRHPGFHLLGSRQDDDTREAAPSPSHFRDEKTEP